MNIPITPVESTQIAGIGYDGLSKTLAVKFKGGSVYHYANVETQLFDDFMAAPSKGKFFGEKIKHFTDKYPFTKQPK